MDMACSTNWGKGKWIWVDIREIGWGCIDWIDLAQDVD
jgi:hypothetical protein